MNLQSLRDGIILKDGIKYFDFTASGLAHKSVEEEILRILQTYSNVHSEVSTNAKITNDYYENAREKLKNLLGLNDNFYLIPTGYGSTGAIKRFQELLGIYIPPMSKERLKLNIDKKNLPLVIVSAYEHHSNELSFREGLCEVVRVPLDENLEFDFNALENILEQNKGREIIASICMASNITGVISDYKRIYKLIKSYGGILALDCSSYAPYYNADCNYFDAIFISSHKLLGGVGACGILGIKKELCISKKPTFASGGTVLYVDRKNQIYKDSIEAIEDCGTPAIIGLIRAYLAFRLRNDIGFDEIERIEKELDEYFLQKFLKLDNVEIYGNLNLKRLPIYSFNIKGINAYDFSAILSQRYEIQTRAGCACVGPYAHDLMKKEDGLNDEMQKPAFVRLGLHYTHTFDDIDYLISALKSLIKKRDKIIANPGRYKC